MTTKPLRVSQSQINCWRECQALYKYRYVDKLERKDRAPAPELGTLLHDYLEHYYRLIGEGTHRLEAHELARDDVLAKWTNRLLAHAEITAQFGGNPEIVEQFAQMPAQVEDMMNRYYSVRGRQDAEEHEIVLVERSVTVTLARGITSTGIIDMVTRSLADGRLYLWEHKSTKDVPSQSYRLRDLQTTLYAAKLRAALEVEVEGVLWNYLRTVPPKEPEPLKSGQFSRAKSQDTCWYTYRRAVERAGQNPDDYADMMELLIPREEAVYFPRFRYNFVAEESILLRDYVESAKEIRQAREDWAAGKRAPVRSLSRSCDWCSHQMICMAEITGGDPQDVIDLRFQSRDEAAVAERTLEPS